MIVTLLSDFGAADFFVGAMKGAVLSVNREATLVDITHEIPAHDVQAGAWTLLAAYAAFPPATVHVAVVDPGVGSERRPLVVSAGGHLFVGPDNGLFSYVIEREGGAAFHLTRSEFFRPQVSSTFHGRDVFAPVAGALAQGIAPEKLGEPIADYVRLAPLRPRRAADGTLEASVIHVDRFGNCITNITPPDVAEGALRTGRAHLIVGGREVRRFQRFFAEGEGAPEPLFTIWGSAGFLEIAAFQSSAARLLGVGRGAPVRVAGGGGES